MDNTSQPTQPPQETHETLKVSTSSDPHHYPKMLLIGLGAFLIIIIGGGIGYFMGVNNTQQVTPEPTAQATSPSPTPSSDPTANWKTYTNTKGGYSFKYPSNWYLIDEKDSSVGISDGEDVPRGPNVGHVYVQFVSGSTSSYDELLNKDVGTIEKGSKLTITTEEKLKIDEYPAVRQIEETTSGASTEPSYTMAIYVKGPTNVKISALALKDKDDFNKNSLQIFNQILSTFKFTDQNSISVPTAIVSSSKTSPTGLYIITEETIGDSQTIMIKDNKGMTITDNVVTKNFKEIGYNVKFGCQCGTSFKGWTDNSHFAIKIVNGNSEEYEYLVDASTGKVDESSFKRIK